MIYTKLNQLNLLKKGFKNSDGGHYIITSTVQYFLPFICELKEVAAMNTSFSFSIITPCPTQNAMRLRTEVLLRFITSEISFRVHSSKLICKALEDQLKELKMLPF